VEQQLPVRRARWSSDFDKKFTKHEKLLSGPWRVDTLALVTPQGMKIDCEQLVNSVSFVSRSSCPAEMAPPLARQSFSALLLTRFPGQAIISLSRLTEGTYAALCLPTLSLPYPDLHFSPL
jgi:hypothetical protein